MSQSVPLICAMAVTVVARMYAALLHERPYCYIIAGLMILVPGGVGVRGKICCLPSTYFPSMVFVQA
jgi:uncharacterized membrane protein YjjB (DUF3815 family)